MDKISVEGIEWSIYINGCFQHSGIVFLSDGTIESSGAEGFFSWQYSNDDVISVYDELGVINYQLKYIDSAKLLISVSKFRMVNNEIFLSAVISESEMSEMYSDDMSKMIANKSSSYKSLREKEIWGYPFFGIDGKIYNYHNNNECYWIAEHGRLYILNNEKIRNAESLFVQKDKDGFAHIVLKNIDNQRGGGSGIF